ncbi:Ornithine carbamoyltransferase, mitochondrial [Psilocybe cubensis]|uniref:Ornithine carbamoyltransferase, mitochondrial n=2 Tax=Psilocybe cubensis TaxID=181762 RepID=A0ACB8GQJ6_PSICU|nr:Ornithine carbamoyltransferase, mitochondrial [Psilocybe cubensis]KAH9477893.1 Ornithine carbamoyltransferase, mitochondrial [Psilocybe cubensis]
MRPPHLMTLADLSPWQIKHIVNHAHMLKTRAKPWMGPQRSSAAVDGSTTNSVKANLPAESLHAKTIALLFSKRSTRTRLAAETSVALLGGRALFLGRDDIQMGVNESVRDTARIVSGMCQGIVARVGDHSEIEEIAKWADVPVVNALSSLWHPTQILAGLLTLHDHAAVFQSLSKPTPTPTPSPTSTHAIAQPETTPALPALPPLTIAYVGDCANVLHDMLVAYPRLGHRMRVAAPLQYRPPAEVMRRVVQLGCNRGIEWFENPLEAVYGAHVVVTDTWVSMGQEAEKEERIRAFEGYQVTEKLCAHAHPDWMFMHCLPRKSDEVNDEVFYGPRSLVFQEADNRKWTTMALFDLLFGQWSLGPEDP